MGISLVSSAPAIKQVNTGNTGYDIQFPKYIVIEKDKNFTFHSHIFNISNGYPIGNGDTNCFLHLYEDNGGHILKTQMTFDGIEWETLILGSNFSHVDTHGYIVYCNSSIAGLGGFASGSFEVTNNGETLSEATSINFNFAMLFLMILFITSIVGIFTTENYIGKFVLYWVAHLLFIIGTFSLWQFNYGYTIAYIGLAGIYKVMFYISAIAVVPMVFLSMAWIFYIHTFNEHFQKLVDKGIDTEEAFATAKKKSGGWFDGR